MRGGLLPPLLRALLLLALPLLALAVSACARSPLAPILPEEAPVRLSDWGVMRREGDRLAFADGVTPYALNTPLYTDGAAKLRTLWLPAGAAARSRDPEAFDFPVGTILTKTFYYPGADGEGGLVSSEGDGTADVDLSAVRLIETRLLVRHADGWRAYPYLWDADQRDARLAPAGAALRLTVDGAPLAYIAPARTQCAACHAPDQASKALSPLGPTARSLNRASPYLPGAPNQLAHLAANGRLVGLPSDAGALPANAVWSDTKAPLEARARAYLDVNCGHCHNPTGPARTSGLYLHAAEQDPMRLGVCKPPVAAGRGTGGRRVGIAPGAPEASIVVHRMASDDPGAMMPEIGRSRPHEEGVALIAAWIAALPGGCAPR